MLSATVKNRVRPSRKTSRRLFDLRPLGTRDPHTPGRRFSGVFPNDLKVELINLKTKTNGLEVFPSDLKVELINLKTKTNDMKVFPIDLKA